MASQAQIDRAAEIRERIVELSRQGLTCETIADKYNVSVTTVYRARALAGIGVKMNFASEDEKLQAKMLLVDGCSYEEVARTLHRASSTIAYWHPGYQFTPAQKGQASAMARKLNRMTDRLGESRKPAGSYS